MSDCESHSPLRPSKSGQWAYLFETRSTFAGKIALGNCTQWRFDTLRHNGQLALGIEDRPIFVWTCEAKPDAVARIYGVQPGDAGNIADLINRQLGVQTRSYGSYLDPFCD